MRNLCSVVDCDRTVNAQGLCPRHYMSALKAGSIKPLQKPTVEQRFWSKVQKTDGCWLWMGRTAGGYGRFDKPGRVSIAAHKWLWVELYGDVPDGLELCHRCDVRNCVKPGHLFLGTRADNMQDMIAKGRGYSWLANQDACGKGHPFDEANTFWYVKNGRRCRNCRACARANAWARRHVQEGPLKQDGKPHPTVVESHPEETK